MYSYTFTKKFIKKAFTGFMALLLLNMLILTGCSKANVMEEETPGESDTLVNADNGVVAEVDFYTAGNYTVGIDMPADEYLITSEKSNYPVYVEIASDASSSLDSIIMNENFYNRIYITVRDGQFLTFSDGVAIPSSSALQYEPTSGLYPSGMYLVGKDIEPGEYRIEIEENEYINSGYFELSEDSTGSIDSIITNGNLENEILQTLESGNYIKLSGTYIQSDYND